MQIYPNLDPKIDLCFLSKSSSILAAQYHSSAKTKTKSLKEWFPKTEVRLLHILEEMLQINPYMRPSAQQLLKNSIFDSVRMSQNEITAPFKIVININQEFCAIDYEN